MKLRPNVALGCALASALILPGIVHAQDPSDTVDPQPVAPSEPVDVTPTAPPALEVEPGTPDGLRPPGATEGASDPLPAAELEAEAEAEAEEDGAEGEDAASESAPPPDDEFGIRGTAELGFVGVLDHSVRLGSDGTEIDYMSDANQTNLYFFARLALELDIWRQHHIIFLYQPLEINTQATLRRDLVIDGLTFPQGSPIISRYGFPFYRVSWDFDVLDDPREQLRLGLGLQIRNATIQFESLDGELFRSRNDIGPVPLLRIALRFPIIEGFWFGWEADGFYAPISVLNGSDTDVQGAILDTSVRIGWRFMDHVEGFVNIRYLGGGASGTGDPTPTSDGSQANWLHFMSLSLGATLDSRPN